MNQALREKLLVTYGYMKGLHGKPIGGSMFGGGVEKMYVPNEIIEPLHELLFPKEETKETEAGNGS